MKADSTQSILPENPIASKIYEVRGHKVMRDSDLATLYDVGTKA
ncbi:ORF6N domain-containing protein [Pedobacter sp. AW1-32]